MQNKKRVVFYLLDGARPDVLKKLLAENKLPHLARIIDEGTFRLATTCLPSTTGPAYLPFLTGHYPGDMNITGIRWFDKKEFRRNRYSKLAMRSYCGPGAAFFNSDMASDKATLFELIGSSYNVYNMVNRGVRREHDITPRNKGLLYTRAHFYKRHHPVDREGHRRVMEMLHKNRDFEFLFVVFPSVDWDSHYHHYEDPRAVEAYRIADESIGEVREELEKKGWWQDTLFLLTSDHGLTETENHFDVGDWMTDHDLRALYYPTIWKTAPKSAVMISGNSFGSVHLLQHSGDHALGYKALLGLMGTDRLKFFLKEEAIDFIACRGDDDQTLVVSDHEGMALVQKHGEVYRYIPQTGDPLQYGEEMQLRGHRNALEASFGTAYPDAVVQLSQLFKSSRAGDFIVCANSGYDLRDFWEFPEHKGSHGSLVKEHMLVPLVYNQVNRVSHPVRTADLFTTILTWLGKLDHASVGDPLF